MRLAKQQNEISPACSLTRYLEQKYARCDRRIDRVAVLAHGNAHGEIGRFDQLLRQSALLVSDHENCGKSIVQNFVVHQSRWGGRHNRDSVRLSPVDEFARRTLYEL